MQLYPHAAPLEETRNLVAVDFALLGGSLGLLGNPVGPGNGFRENDVRMEFSQPAPRGMIALQDFQEHHYVNIKQHSPLGVIRERPKDDEREGRRGEHQRYAQSDDISRNSCIPRQYVRQPNASCDFPIRYAPLPILNE
jgi:hypothetical protein